MSSFRHLPAKALLLSILLHLIAFTSFVFTFPVRSVAHRPQFVFWGSILERRDVLGGAWDEAVFPHGEATAESGELSKEDLKKMRAQATSASRGLFAQGFPEKSFIVKSVAPDQKQTMKPALEMQIVPDEPSGMKRDDGRQTDSNIPSYKPLRLSDFADSIQR